MSSKFHAITRRGLLSGLAGVAVASLVGGTAKSQDLHAANFSKLFGVGENEPLFANARRNNDGSFGLSVFDGAGQIVFTAPLPDRGHSISFDRNSGKLIAFARRPGNFAVLMDGNGTQNTKVFTSPDDRHFYGHGVFSSDGKLLYAPENDWQSKRGVIGIYDLSGTSPKRLGEIESHGVGPHDVLVCQKTGALVVANGGIYTRPDKAREKLNIDSMKPNVSWVDPKTGELLVRNELPTSLHQLSLRHMSQDGEGKVWIGGQYQGPTSHNPPLVAAITRDGEPKLLEMPGTLQDGLQNYIGSVTANRDGSVVATSCPRGGKVLFWKSEDLTLIGAQDIPDGCGVAPIDQQAFLISDGNGGVRYLEDAKDYAEVLAYHTGISWDNHLIPIG
ncbi:DUF1513 domain-containing protein [Flexibacterium corallicola]|uniref:DUF1513 domain-containing protein n=1 Tax=Flexibacterium corallicola TaxID=3037259 RepID=UPI00286EE383|nr:DUF1513 domain-containing protein [Pseudovibrio sp. M1P-2-3]